MKIELLFTKRANNSEKVTTSLRSVPIVILSILRLLTLKSLKVFYLKFEVPRQPIAFKNLNTTLNNLLLV